MKNQDTQTHPEGFLLVRSGNVLDVRSLTLRDSIDVLIQGDRIVRMGKNLEAPEGAKIIEAQGLTVMPGLIDCHVHVVASTFNLGAAAKMPNVLATLRAVPILEGMLRRGFTSVRDAGGADWSLCEAVRTQIVQGPRIFAAGKALSQTGGHGDFRSRDESLDACSCSDRLGNIGRVVDGVDACRLAVREEILKGAQQIKIMASGGVASPNDPIGNFGFSEAEIRAIVEEASNANTYVMAHAYTPKAIARAVRLGVRTIEHGNLVDVDTAKAMRDHGAFMVPTLVTYEALARDGQRLGLPAASVAKIEDVRGAAKRALEILAKEEVPMGLGSDLLGEAHMHQSEELTLRAEVLGNGTALQQATLVGADILGRAGTLGELVPGATADILLVDGNPLLNLSCLLDQGRHLRAVIKDGRLCSTPTSVHTARLLKHQLGAFIMDRRNILKLAGSAAALQSLSSLVFAQAPGTFRIGSLLPLTGAGSPYGPGMQQAMRIAVEEVNAAGGVAGRKLELFSEDDQTKPDAAVLAAKKLIDVNKVQALLGTWASGVTLAVMPLTDSAGIIEMNVSGAPAISTLDTKDLVWRFQATNDRFGAAFAEICTKRGFKRPATMAFNNASGLGNVEGFARAWKKQGGEVVASVVYEPARPSYRSELQKILAAKPDVIVTGSYLPDTTIILREWFQSGADNKWIIPGWAANTDLVKALGAELCEGLISVETVSNEKSGAYTRFDAAYQKATGKPASTNIYAAMAYDMVISLALAIEAAGANASVEIINARIREVSNAPGTLVTSFSEGKALLAKKSKVNYDGASSKLDFDKFGDATPDFGVYVIEKGELVRRDTVSITAA